MNEEKFIDTLFEKARHEAPIYTYESVTHNFMHTLSISSWSWVKTWLIKPIHNNIWMTVSIGALVVSAVTWMVAVSDTPASLDVTSEISEHAPMLEKSPPATILSATSSLKDSASELPVNVGEVQIDSVMVADIFPAPKPAIRKLNLLDTLPLADSEIILSPISKQLSSPITLSPRNISTRPVRLILKKSHTQAELEELVLTLQEMRLNANLETDFSTIAVSSLERIILTLKHEQGLNLKLEGIGFDQLELVFELDNKEQLQHFRYRFNEEPFTRPIPLDCTGEKSHQYGDGFSGVSGTTSVNIAPYSPAKESRTHHIREVSIGTLNAKLHRESGKVGFHEFLELLQKDLPVEVDGKAWYRDSQQLIKKFTLKIPARTGMNIHIHSAGFETFELEWKIDKNAKLVEFGYRFDDGPLKPLPTNQSPGQTRHRVKYLSSEN